MKFKVRVTLDIAAPGSGLKKADLTPLVVQAVEDALEQSLYDCAYDTISVEVEQENWDALEVSVEMVEG